MYGAIKLMLHT